MAQTCSFCYLLLRFTDFAQKIRNYLLLCEFLETLLNIAKILDFDRQIKEIFFSIAFSVAVLADDLVAGFSAVNTVQNELKRCVFYWSLYFIEDHVQELLSILLNGDIHWHILIVFETKTEILRVILLSCTKFEEGEHYLELMKHVIIEKLRVLQFCVSWH